MANIDNKSHKKQQREEDSLAIKHFFPIEIQLQCILE